MLAGRWAGPYTSTKPENRKTLKRYLKNVDIKLSDSQPQVITVYQLLAHGQWFSPGTPVSSTTKTGRHDVAEIFLKVALKHQKSNQINQSINQI